jgi:hypothetical protein
LLVGQGEAALHLNVAGKLFLLHAHPPGSTPATQAAFYTKQKVRTRFALSNNNTPLH